MPHKRIDPVPVEDMLDNRRLGHHTICQTLREAYYIVDNLGCSSGPISDRSHDPHVRMVQFVDYVQVDEIKLKLRLAMAMAKRMQRKLERYKEMTK